MSPLLSLAIARQDTEDYSIECLCNRRRGANRGSRLRADVAGAGADETSVRDLLEDVGDPAGAAPDGEESRGGASGEAKGLRQGDEAEVEVRALVQQVEGGRGHLGRQLGDGRNGAAGGRDVEQQAGARIALQVEPV